MRAQLLHLSGPHRGRTATYEKKTLLLGSSLEADVRYPAGGKVQPRHAELRFVDENCEFHLKALDGEVFVNRQQIEEVILVRGDLLELGRNGPKIRFRMYAEPGNVCKPVRQMFSDAAEVGSASGIYTATRSLTTDLVRHATLQLKVGFPLVVVCAFLAAYFGTWLAGQLGNEEQEASRRALELQEQELARLRDQLKEFQRHQAGHASRTEVAKLREELKRYQAVVDDAARRNSALKRVLEVYSGSVCLLHGIFTLKTTVQGKLVPVKGPDGKPLELEYVGSGFLVSEEGDVITNRHVAEPWWNNRTVAPLLRRGFVPDFVRLEAVFPGRSPVDVDTSTIRFSPQSGVDVAILRVPVKDLPVLPLFEGDIRTQRGGRVILLGYPTGINAMLARADPDVAREATAVARDTTSLISELAKRKLISPVITQGALNEVKEKKLVYDAETTSGGSGGPVFGPDGTVIGVNFAITRNFDGSNFGIPIRFARELLP